MPKPVCVTCEVEMQCVAAGALMVELAFDPPSAYQAWACDIYECPRCGVRITTGYADRPTAHFEPEFKEEIKETPRRWVVLCYESADTAASKPVTLDDLLA